jgi:GalNAc-alpha-(1->4)-GalNAc-alpha-(1->3)-diNAcBac-PP-undecaprenol alpha-1,4-N-acetyl-D-galactosaminyltransferase
MRIVSIIPTMGPGGAERSMSHLLAHLAKRHAVTLLTFERPDKPSFYPVPPSVKYLRVDQLGGYGLQRVLQMMARAKLMRRTVKTRTPDVVISFMVGINITALTSCVGLGVPIVVSERIDPSEHCIGRVKELARAYTYPLARLIVVQTSRVASYFPPSLQPKIRIVGNAVVPAPVTAQPSADDRNGRKRIIAVGRCDPQKGFDRLIDAFALIANHYPDWDAVIVGDGPERLQLEDRVRRRGLEARINITGFVSDVYQELSAAQLIAFPSRNEGFPNALAEGLAAGLPAVGYKGVSGVEDLIIDGKTGLLVDQKEEIAGLARALSTLMADAQLRVSLGNAALRHVGQWAPDRMFALWDEVLSEAVAAPAKMAPVRIQS